MAGGRARQAPPPDPAVVDRLVGELSNWGRWGPDDELGTLNLVTSERRLAALAAARTGQAVSLSRRLAPKPVADDPKPVMHLMARTGAEGPSTGFWSVSDWIGIGFHGFGVTHLDALCHVLWNGRSYNDRPGSEIGAAHGAPHNNVERVRDGIVARAALFDVPRALGVDWLEPGEGIGPDVLSACEAALESPLAAGDALLLRFGRDARRDAKGAHDPLQGGFPGLLPECLPWLHERDLALIGSDAVTDVMLPDGAPHLMPVHVVTLVAMGVHLLDNAHLEVLAAACAAAGRNEFCLTVAPLVVAHATGSPVNPIAIL